MRIIKQKAMIKALYSTYLLLLLISVTIFISCNNGKRKNSKFVDNSYDIRVANFTKYLKSHPEIKMESSCGNFYLMQIDKCNTCDASSFMRVVKDIKARKIVTPFFILTSDDNSLVEEIGREFSNQAKFYIVNDNDLKRLGLSFMKNLFINVCADKIKEWYFY